MVKEKKKKRRPYRTTRRYNTKQKTTTKDGKREYMSRYMREYRAALKKEAERLKKLKGGK